MEDNQRTDCSFRLSLKIITVTEAYAFMHPIIDNTALLIAPLGPSIKSIEIRRILKDNGQWINNGIVK